MQEGIIKKKYRVWYRKPDVKYNKFTNPEAAILETCSGKKTKDIFKNQHPEFKVTAAILIGYEKILKKG